MSVELTAGPRSFTRRAIPMVVALAVLVAGCGADPDEDADEPATSAHALRADYQQNWGELGRVHLEVTTTGPEEVRVRWTTPEDDPPSEIVWVYDGEQLLEYSNDPEGYTLYKEPEQSEGFELVAPSSCLREAIPSPMPVPNLNGSGPRRSPAAPRSGTDAAPARSSTPSGRRSGWTRQPA